MVSTNGLIEVLLPLSVLSKDLRPGWSDEYDAIVAKDLSGPPHVFGHGQPAKSEIPQDIRDTAIEDECALILLGRVVGTHVPGQHQLRKKLAILPRQRLTVNRDLIFDHPTPGLRRSLVTLVLHRFDQGSLPRSWSARDDEEALGIL